MLLITIVLHIILCSYPSGQLVDGWFNEHEKINKYLIERSSEDDLFANVELARGWMTKLKLDEPMFPNNKLLQALELFASLRFTWNLSGCTMKSYEILRNNSEAFGKRSLHRMNLDLSRLSRMEKIVHEYSVHHAIFCRKVYPEVYKLTYKQTLRRPQLRLKRLFYLLFKEYQSFRSPDQPFDALDIQAYEDMVREPKLFEYPSSSQAMLEGLKSLSRSNPERMYLCKSGCEIDDLHVPPFDARKRTTKVATLLDSYLLEPCRFFIKTFGGIFIPAEYDEELLEIKERANDEDSLWFYIGRGHFNICRRLVSDKKEVDLLVKGVESAIVRSE